MICKSKRALNGCFRISAVNALLFSEKNRIHCTAKISILREMLRTQCNERKDNGSLTPQHAARSSRCALTFPLPQHTKAIHSELFCNDHSKAPFSEFTMRRKSCIYDEDSPFEVKDNKLVDNMLHYLSHISD